MEYVTRRLEQYLVDERLRQRRLVRAALAERGGDPALSRPTTARALDEVVKAKGSDATALKAAMGGARASDAVWSGARSCRRIWR